MKLQNDWWQSLIFLVQWVFVESQWDGLTSETAQTSCWIEFEFMIVFLGFYGLLQSRCQIRTSQATQAALQLTWWQCGLGSLPYEYELLSALPAAGPKEKRGSIYRGYKSTNTFIKTGALQRHSFSQFQFTSFEHTKHDLVSMTKVWQSNHPSII